MAASIGTDDFAGPDEIADAELRSQAAGKTGEDRSRTDRSFSELVEGGANALGAHARIGEKKVGSGSEKETLSRNGDEHPRHGRTVRDR
jgi:hypothetical protein